MFATPRKRSHARGSRYNFLEAQAAIYVDAALRTDTKNVPTAKQPEFFLIENTIPWYHICEVEEDTSPPDTIREPESCLKITDKKKPLSYVDIVIR